MKRRLLVCLLASLFAALPARAGVEDPDQKLPVETRKLAAEGHQLIFSGKNEAALDRFQKAWAGGARNMRVPYNAACAASRLGLKDEAFEWLQRVVDSGWEEHEYLVKDDDLKPLHGDARFARVVEAIKGHAARAEAKVENKALRDELVRRVEEDQKARKALIEDGFRSEALKKKAEEIDARNTAWMKTVVEKHGWPGRKQVGERGSQAAFLLAQHADQDKAFQKKCLALLEAAVKAGDAYPRNLAYLTDRVRLADGKPQLYGTQFMKAANGDQVPQPIEDAGNVDERRAALGLPPLAEYTRMLREAYKPRPHQAEVKPKK